MISADSQTSHVQATILIQLIALYLFTAIVKGATNPGDNAAEFKAMCQLVKLAELKPEDATTDEDALRDQDELNILNLTVAPIEWQQNFGDGSDSHKWDNVKTKYEGDKHAGHWQNQWEIWLGIAAHKKKKESNEKFKDEYAAPKSKIARNVAAAQVARYAARAAELRARYEAEIRTLNGPDKKEIVTHLTKALYDMDGKADARGEVPKQKFEDAERKQGDCRGGNVGKNIRYDLMCLCAGKAKGHSKACTTTALTKAWEAAKGDAEAAANALLDKCKEGASLPLTAGNIENAVSTLQSLIGVHTAPTNKAHYLGVGNACSGDDGNLCVEYSEYYKEGDTDKGQTMPWMLNMLEAAKLIRRRDKKIAQNDRRAAEMKGLLTVAQAAIKGAQTYPEEDTQKSGHEPKATQEAISCSNHNTNTTCTADNNCKWEEKDGKDGKCVADDSKFTTQTNTAAGTGDGAAATTTEKCKGKKKDDCKSPDCKWESESCKDSSILATKKFALMVSAAFAALLF